jgi:hypothetical protein
LAGIKSPTLADTPPARRHYLVGQAQAAKAGMADEQNDEQNLGQQLQTAAEAFRETAVRLLRAGEVHPQVIVMAAAQAAGEMGAGLAVAGGDDLERVLGELAAILRQTGREHGEALAVALAPAAGSA